LQQYDGGEFYISYHDQGASRDLLKEIHTPINLKLAYKYDSNNQLAAVNCGSAYRFEYTYDTQGRLTKLAQVPAKR
jgi:YD repeat-containing protein